MVRLLLTSILATACLGCGGRSYKVDHPVVGPVPPRIPRNRSLAMADDDVQARGQSDGVQLVSTATDATLPLEMTDIIATVNGRPILVASVLGSSRAKVDAVRKQLPPAQFRQMQENTIREQLPSHIEQAMMVAAMETKLTADQTKSIATQLDAGFEKQLEKMRAEMQKAEDQKAAKEQRASRTITVVDVEADIQQSGMTIPVMRKMFGDRALAEQYMMAKLEGAEPIGRPEILAAYHERVKEFSEPGSVKWQQIQISFRNFGSKEEAQQQAAAALAELQRGTSFDAVAKKYSDGPDAANGGHWDWTQFESILPEMSEPLSKLPPKTPSPIIVTTNALQIVQVVERREARTKPFMEVQDKLRDELANARHKTRVKEILEELKAQSVVTTMFDDKNESRPASPAANQAVDKAFSTNSPDGG